MCSVFDIPIRLWYKAVANKLIGVLLRWLIEQRGADIEHEHSENGCGWRLFVNTNPKIKLLIHFWESNIRDE